MMRSPISVWRSMKRHSPASSGPGFSRISSGIATLPTSCSSAAIRTWSISPGVRLSVRATCSASWATSATWWLSSGSRSARIRSMTSLVSCRVVGRPPRLSS